MIIPHQKHAHSRRKLSCVTQGQIGWEKKKKPKACALQFLLLFPAPFRGRAGARVLSLSLPGAGDRMCIQCMICEMYLMPMPMTMTMTTRDAWMNYRIALQFSLSLSLLLNPSLSHVCHCCLVPTQKSSIDRSTDRLATSSLAGSTQAYSYGGRILVDEEESKAAADCDSHTKNSGEGGEQEPIR